MFFKAFFYSNLLLLLVGCASVYIKPDDPRFAPIIPDIDPTPKPRGGSLFVANNTLELYEDNRSHKVGDIILVALNEKTDATKAAQTHFDKEDQVTIPNPTILGTGASFNLPTISRLAQNKGLNLAANTNTVNKFKGEADSSQNNSLAGKITVTVSQVLPNKNLLIRGEKWINLNQGSEYIRLTGIIRPDDIQPDNTISSTRIADARITYSGTGTLDETNALGWLARFFNSPINPF